MSSTSATHRSFLRLPYDTSNQPTRSPSLTMLIKLRIAEQKSQKNIYVRIGFPRSTHASCPPPVPRPSIRHSLLPALVFPTTGKANPSTPRQEKSLLHGLLQREPSMIPRLEYPILAGPLRAVREQYFQHSLLPSESSRTQEQQTHPLPDRNNARFADAEKRTA